MPAVQAQLEGHWQHMAGKRTSVPPSSKSALRGDTTGVWQARPRWRWLGRRNGHLVGAEGGLHVGSGGRQVAEGITTGTSTTRVWIFPAASSNSDGSGVPSRAMPNFAGIRETQLGRGDPPSASVGLYCHHCRSGYSGFTCVDAITCVCVQRSSLST